MALNTVRLTCVLLIPVNQIDNGVGTMFLYVQKCTMFCGADEEDKSPFSACTHPHTHTFVFGFNGKCKIVLG